MAAPVPLRWQAAAMPRAKQIAPEDWAAHEAEIRKLYENTTLDEMMKTMKDNHGFKPTYVSGHPLQTSTFNMSGS
jgi:hypothetical protein